MRCFRVVSVGTSEIVSAWLSRHVRCKYITRLCDSHEPYAVLSNGSTRRYISINWPRGTRRSLARVGTVTEMFL